MNTLTSVRRRLQLKRVLGRIVVRLAGAALEDEFIKTNGHTLTTTAIGEGQRIASIVHHQLEEDSATTKLRVEGDDLVRWPFSRRCLIARVPYERPDSYHATGSSH